MTAFIIKQTFCIGFLSLSAISLSSPSLAISGDQVPNPRQVNNGWVTDIANVLSPSTKAQRNKLISNPEAKKDSEIAVVTVPEIAPAKTPKQFATALFKHWKIGKVNRKNGVLLLISKGDRLVEIETGYGVKKILPDARVGNIVQQMTLRLKQGDYNGGTQAGTKALVIGSNGVAYSSIALIQNKREKPHTASNLPIVIVLGFGALIAGAGAIFSGRSRGDDGNNSSDTFSNDCSSSADSSGDDSSSSSSSVGDSFSNGLDSGAGSSGGDSSNSSSSASDSSSSGSDSGAGSSGDDSSSSSSSASDSSSS